MAKILICVAVCLFSSGCVMVESYFKPLPGQGTSRQDFITWNRPAHLDVDIGSQGRWLITQWLGGWENELHLQVTLSVDENKSVELASREVVVDAAGDRFAVKLSQIHYPQAPQLRWESGDTIELGKKIYREYTLLLPAVVINGQSIETKPVYFKRGKGLIFYRILQ